MAENSDSTTRRALHDRALGTEDWCGRCGQRNVHCWYVESALWNAIMRDQEGREVVSIVCPRCFTDLYETVFPEPPPIWELRLKQGARP